MTWPAASGDESLPVDAGGILIQKREGSDWRTLSEIQPAVAEDVVGLCALREGGRAVLSGVYTLQQVAGAFRTSEATFALAAAWHSGLGMLDPATVGSGAGLRLAAGDSASLSYDPAEGDSSADPWYLLLQRTSTTNQTLRLRPVPAANGLPQRFALHQNQPNPFAQVTTIRLDLPVGAMVQLEVFDVLGRRVRMLSHRFYLPGYQAVDWDRRDGTGRRVAPGIYVYHLQAGAFRDRKKMALLP